MLINELKYESRPEIIRLLAYMNKYQIDPSLMTEELIAGMKSLLVERSMSQGPAFTPIKFRRHTLVDPAELKYMFTHISDDLLSLYALITAIEDGGISVLEYLDTKRDVIGSEINQALSAIANVEISTGALHSGVTVNRFDFDSESENSLTSPSKSPLYLDPFASAIMLGLSKDIIEHSKVLDIEVLPASNGTAGISADGQVINNHLGSILTSGINSYSYERVGNFRDNLVLKLLFSFPSLEIMNNLLIQFNKGDISYPLLEKLEISSDGITWVNILKESFPGLQGGLIINGIRSIHFLPRQVQFARLTIKQNDKKTLVGGIERELIDIKQMVFRTFTFNSSGEFIGKSISAPNELLKARVLSNFIGSSKDVHHSLSPNSEAWLEIDDAAQLDAMKTSLTFNISDLPDYQGSPVTSLTYKLALTNSNIPIDFQQKNEYLNQIDNISISGLQKVNLSYTPKAGTLRVALSDDVAVGGLPYKIRNYNGLENDWIIVNIPFYVQPYSEQLVIDGRKWTRIPLGKLTTEVSINNGLVYQYDYENQILYFPKTEYSEDPQGRDIQLFIKQEKLIPSSKDIFKFENSSLGLSNSIRIFSLSGVPETYTERISSGKRKFMLLRKNLLQKAGYEAVILGVTGSSWGKQVEYLTGQIEFDLDSSGTYSVDYKNGVVYFSALADTSDVDKIQYHICHRKLISSTYWNLIEDSFDEVQLNSGYLVYNASFVNEEASKHLTILDLDFGRIKYLSCDIVGLTEVPFQNGNAEFDNYLEEERATKFSVDYRNNEIYFYTDFTGTIKFSYSNLEVEYPIGFAINPESYSLNNKEVTFNDKEFTSHLAENRTALFSYQYKPEIGQTGSQIDSYYSPIVYGVSIMTLNKNQLLGG
jgi:hypothetical protein